MAKAYEQQQKAIQLLQIMALRHPDQKQILGKIQKTIKAKLSDAQVSWVDQEAFVSVFLQVKKILKSIVKVCAVLKQQQFFNEKSVSKQLQGFISLQEMLVNSYKQYKKLVNPIVHNEHNLHQYPYHAMHINSAHMKMNLLKELQKQTLRRKQAEKKLDDYFNGVKRVLVKKQQMIKELQAQLDEPKQTIQSKPQNVINLQESKINNLMQYVTLLQQKLHNRQQQNQQNRIALQKLQYQFAKLSQERKIQKVGYQSTFQNLDHAVSPSKRISRQLLKQQQIKHVIEDKPISEHNSICSFNLLDNFNRSNQTQGWNQGNRNLTNLHFAPILGTPQADRKAKSYFKPVLSPTVKMDQLWRFLYVQAQSIQNMLESQQARNGVCQND